MVKAFQQRFKDHLVEKEKVLCTNDAKITGYPHAKMNHISYSIQN